MRPAGDWGDTEEVGVDIEPDRKLRSKSENYDNDDGSDGDWSDFYLSTDKYKKGNLLIYHRNDSIGYIPTMILIFVLFEKLWSVDILCQIKSSKAAPHVKTIGK